MERDELIRSGMPLALHLARVYARGPFARFYEEARTAVLTSLVCRASTFDPERGCAWSTYLSFHVRRALGELTKYCKHAGRLDAILCPEVEAHGLAAPEVERPDPIARRALGHALERLPARERTVVALRFGFAGAGPLRYSDVGVVVGCTRATAAGIELEALTRLRGMLT